MKVFVPGPLTRIRPTWFIPRARNRRGTSPAPGFGLSQHSLSDEQDQVREHIKIFVNEEQQRDLAGILNPSDEIQIICVLSGGSDE